jgi:hypothetical protein
MAGSERKLSRKQEEAIVGLLSTRSVEEAARACNTPVRLPTRSMRSDTARAVLRDMEHHIDLAIQSTITKMWRRNSFGTPFK